MEMSYRWTRGDIAVVRRYLRENNQEKEAVIAALLDLVSTLKKDEIAVAIEIAEDEKLYEKGELSLDKLLESRARLGLNEKGASRYDYI